MNTREGHAAESPLTPAGRPTHYHGPAAWTAGQMRERDDWIHELGEEDLRELNHAAAAAADVEIVRMSREDFPLPQLGPRLQRILHDVTWGRGFALIRGFPVEGLSRETMARMYYGLGLWCGDPVPQNAAGHLLGHVRDIGHDPHNPEHRVYATNYRHLFHTDSCDIVGLLCLRPAKSGGRSAIASSTSLYNRLADERPEFADVLSEAFHVDRKGEVPEGKGPTYELAVYHHGPGYLTAIYARDFIQAAQRFEDVPRLSELQVEAMDRLDELAASDEFRLDMDFRPGDIQLLHNHQILHARTAYVDHPEPERKRHLLRLWLSAAEGRELPSAFSERYGPVQLGSVRGGVRVPGQVLQAPLEPE